MIPPTVPTRPRPLLMALVFASGLPLISCASDQAQTRYSPDRQLLEAVTVVLVPPLDQSPASKPEPPARSSPLIVDPGRDQDLPPSPPVSETDTLRAQIAELKARDERQTAEILALYRRLHIELDDAHRSALVIDLLSDPRLAVELLGFELVDRDLSSSTVIDPKVGEKAKALLGSPIAQIRSKAARLITRLVPPDAMIVLTQSLAKETDPKAAEPMLMGIARWPNPDAVAPTLDWFAREGSAFPAACGAAWALEQAGLLDVDPQHSVLIERLRRVDAGSLSEPGMKLIAKLGNASDLRELVAMMLDQEHPSQQQWAAGALVETPRAVEVLVQAAEDNSKLFAAASEALIRHRGTPEGLRRLVSLPAPDPETKDQAIVRLGAVLDAERLAEAVRLAELDPALSAALLNRLLSGDIKISPRIAKGIILLAGIQLDELRPNRAFEAAIALDQITLEQNDRATVDSIKACSLILLGKMAEALAINKDPGFWDTALARAPDAELRRKIAAFMLESFADELDESHAAELRTSAKQIVERTPESLDPEPPGIDQ